MNGQGCDEERVDILMATYNNVPFLEPQIESILRQDHTSWRLLIRDDGSKDGTREVGERYAKRFPRKIRVVHDECGRLGPCGNFARLVEYSDAPYIMFADADDVWLPDKIRISLARCREIEGPSRETPALVFTDLEVVDENLDTIAESFWRYQRLDPTKTRLNRLLTHNVVTGCTVLFNRALRSVAVPIPGDAKMHDAWMALTASAFGRIDFIPKATVLYRQHGANRVGALEGGWRLLCDKISDIPGTLQTLLIRKRKDIRQARAFLRRY